MNNKIRVKGWLLGLLISGAGFPALFSPVARAELSVETMSDFTLGPVVNTSSAPPMVMMTMSQDHQYYLPAYNDYTDLDPGSGDGIETTYKHGFDYYGYFDSHKCYIYDNGAGIFEPVSITPDKYCAAAWSGNFLNWTSMTRMDAVRKILFGGLRYIDTAATTVLERAFLTTDAHSFAKFYQGNDIGRLTPFAPPVANADLKKNGITICNTTGLSAAAESQDATEPPLMRMASGNYSLWAANDTWQCLWKGEKNDVENGNDPDVSGINAHTFPPDAPGTGGNGLLEMVVRVRACVPGLIGREKCRQYPNGNRKPIGLLQKYGEDELMLFGMMAGSYSKNTSGGTLIREMGSIREEVNWDTDGTFTLSITGQGKGWGAINAWTLYRITDYQYSDGTYGRNGSGSCADNLTDIATNRCRNWGNPFAEIALNTLRYYGGNSVTGQYRANDSAIIKDLNTPQVWDKDFLDENNFCSPLVSVNFNASVISYDGDELDGNGYGVQSDLGSPMDSVGLANVVGGGEGISGGTYFVGRVGGVGDDLCTAKVVTGLGEVSGLCPEGARLAGTQRLGGLAWYSHISDINPLKGFQNVDHYSVALSTAAPKAEIAIPGTGQLVTLLPACRNLDQQGTPGNCGLAGFKVLEQDVVAGTGRILAVWDQSEQGGNYDQDMWGTIDWAIVDGEITVATRIFAATPRETEKLGFGYVIGGTTQDGFHVHSGINGFNYDEPSAVPGCENCRIADGWTEATYVLGAAGAGLLEDPLWYAAKWGGFTDKNGNNIPDRQDEWDRFDADGNEDPDGIPDNLFFAADPGGLEEALERAFLAILKRISSGTAAAVVANSSKGIGAAYQALYQPKRDDQFDNEVRWLGTVQSLWVDSFGLLREDNSGGTGNAVLDGYATDQVVEFFYDEIDQRTKFRRIASSDDGEFIPAGFTVHELEEVRPIWNARERLSDLSEAEVGVQRSYGSSAASGRYITTWIDEDRDGLIDAGEHKNFSYSSSGSTGINDTTAFYLNVESTLEAENLVRYIRGVELAGHRSRTLDYDGDGLLETMRLGDIIHSTPTLVGPPSEAFDLLYGDLSYSQFLESNKNRRHMIIVGGNDGMIHGLNAGFFNVETSSFSASGPGGAVAHPLGSELWAYVPGNVLPHLRWLKSANYSHVYYIDGKPRVFDAKVRNGSSWGTFMVVPMRLGTGRITTDTDNDGFDGDDDLTSYPAYIVMDITDPEQPPKVLAEIVMENPSYTTAEPTVAVFRDPAGALNEWYLVLASGPTELTSATTAQNMTVEIHDLSLMALNLPSRVRIIAVADLDATASFAGDLITADWDLDFKTDAIYFGSISGSSDGAVWKLDTGENASAASWQIEKYFDTNAPVSARPSLGLDEFGFPYAFFGTGRIFSNADKSNPDAQRIYGVKDIELGRGGSLPVSIGNLENITGIQVFEDGSVQNGPAGVGTFEELTNFFDDPDNPTDGWYRDLPTDGISPSPRVVSSSVLLGGVLLQPVFTPGGNQCGAEGTSELFGLFFKTGTGSADPNILGTVAGVTNGDGAELVEISIDLGIGLGASPSLHVGEGTGTREATSFVQTSTGTIIRTSVITLFPVDSGEVSWREMNP